MAGRIRNFFRDLSGQFSIIAAFIFLILVVAAGGVTDVMTMSSARQKIQYAADSASLSASNFVMTEQGNEAAAITHAKEVYWQNCQDDYCRNPVVTFANNEISVKGTARLENQFLSIMGKPVVTVRANASSALVITQEPTQIDVYFLFDVSSSMMFPDTQAGVSLMEANFEPFGAGAGGCAFACHANTGTAQTGDQIAQAQGVFLREDRMRREIDRIATGFMDNSDGNTRISLISFGWDARELVSLTELKSVIDAGLLDSDYIEVANGTGTNFETAFSSVVNDGLIPGSPGDGSEENPKNIVILITDGVYSTNPASTRGAIADQPINPQTCDIIKNTGAELFVLNLEYPNPADLLLTSANTARLANMNNFYDQIAPNLESCSSPNRYFRGKFNTDIIQAFDDIEDSIFASLGDEEFEVRLTR